MRHTKRARGRTAGLLFTSLAIAGLAACDGDPFDLPPEASFTVLIENIGTAYDFPASGVFNTPVGASAPSAIGPGGAYEFSFAAPPGSYLSLATMFVPSNDFFFAPDGQGIALWNAGTPVSGDVTDQFSVWDAGTEINQEPGEGADQVQRQSGPNTGAADPTAMVRAAPDDFGNLPATADVIEVTVTPQGGSMFTVRVENVSTPTTLTTSAPSMQPVPLSPGVWVVHTGADPLFTDGAADFGDGLEAIAEDGDPSTLGSALAARTGLTAPLSPGAWVVHTTPDALFTEASADFGDGLEAIAEDGDPSTLGASLAASAAAASGVFDTPVGASGPGAIGPGGSYEFMFDATEGDFLSFATMFVPSNDLFFAPDAEGIALFDASGDPISGDLTTELDLWDAGTEVNQQPGVGTTQVMFQSGPDIGADENGTVRRIGAVTDGFGYPATSAVIRVTITPGS